MFGRHEPVLVGLIAASPRKPVVDAERLISQPGSIVNFSPSTTDGEDKTTYIMPIDVVTQHEESRHINEWRVMTLGDSVCLIKRDSA